MAGFNCVVSSEGKTATCRFSGPIDENADLPAIDAQLFDKVIFDLDQVSHINSIGIKAWIEWVVPIAAVAQVIYQKCPKSIILQINMVKNFLPQNANVESFYLPMYCEECDEEKNILLDVETNLKNENGNVEIVGVQACEVMGCGKSAEECLASPDVIPKKYFRFLTNN